MESSPLDVIAVGAHPDDVEIACGGTLARLARQGYRVGIVDLTDGEPTPLCPSPEVRLAEARRAAETWASPAASRWICRTAGSSTRSRRGSRWRRSFAAAGRDWCWDWAARRRWLRPTITRPSLIIEAAVFYSKLTKWDEYFDGLSPYLVPRLLYFGLSFQTVSAAAGGVMVVDIGETLETKLAAIGCYASQFPAAKTHILDRFRAFAVQQGMAAGFEAGELIASPATWGTRDLMGLLFG